MNSISFFKGMQQWIATFTGLTHKQAAARIGVYFGPFSGIPSAATVGAGAKAYLTDFGGLEMVSNGTYWRPVNRVAVLRTQVSDVSTTAGTSEQIFTAEQIALPAGFLQIGCVIRTYATYKKSDVNDAATLRTRLGSAGTTADASIFTAYTSLGASALVTAIGRALRIASATTALPLGINTATITSAMGAGSTPGVPPVTIPNISGALVLSQSAQLGGSTDIVTIQGYTVEILFP